MSKDHSMKNNVMLSFGEEIGNSVTHGVMSLFLLFFLPYASVRGYLQGGTILAVGFSVFIISLFFMFLASTLYHAMAFNTKHKFVFRILDHIGIYFAIAGTYTPICMYVIGGYLGYGMLAVQWLMVLFGVLYKCIARKSIPKITVTIYLVMGWTAVILLPQLLQNTSWLFVGLIALGGILYSIGTYFYMQKDKPYFHMIWHFFINFASIAHFIAIIYFIK